MLVAEGANTRPLVRAAAPVRPLRILVVEDHEVLRSGLRWLLTRVPWVERCVGARNTGEALLLAESIAFDQQIRVGRDRGLALLLNGVTDPIAPTIAITSPADGASITQGTAATLAFFCDDDQTVVSCTATDRGVPIAGGAALPTASGDVGPHTVTVTARDAAGNVTVKSITYNVVATATGSPSGSVPATLSLSLGTPTASLGSFIPGVAGVYSSAIAATVISTAGEAALSVADPSSTATGHLVNGSFVMPQALQVRATNTANASTVFAPLGADPLALLSYPGPVSNDAVTFGYRQNVAANDALRTGPYSKTLTFTLSTTTP